MTTCKFICGKSFVAFGCCVLFAASAAAETVRMVKDGKHTDAANWSDGKAPHSGADYLLPDWRQIEFNGGTSTGETTFGGDSLQLGEVGKNKTRANQCGGAKFTVNLKLGCGDFRVWSSDASHRNKELAGTVTVLAPESKPFYIVPANGLGSVTRAVWTWTTAVSGAEGTSLMIADHFDDSKTFNPGLGCVRLMGANAGYLGVWTISGTKLEVELGSSDALGGALSSFRADSVKLDGPTLHSASNAVVKLASSRNRGIYVTAKGGTLDVPSDSVLELGWPVSGAAATPGLVKTGVGTLALATDPAVPLLVSEGCLAAPAGVTQTVSGVTFANESGVTLAGKSGDADGLLVVTGWQRKDNAKIGVYCPTSVPEKGVPYQIASFDKASGTLTRGDFIAKYDWRMDACAARGVLSLTETDDAYVLSVTYDDLVYSVKAGEGVASYDDAVFWSDGRATHAGANYLVAPSDKWTCVYIGGSQTDVTFPGETLTFHATTDWRSGWFMQEKSVTGDIFVSGTQTRFYQRFNTTLRGRLTLIGNARFFMGGNHTTTIESTIEGPGEIATHQDNSSSGTLVLTGTNTFTGNINISGSNSHTLRFKGESLGSSGDIYYNSSNWRIYPIGSVVSPRMSRYLASGAVEVDENEVFETPLWSEFRTGRLVLTKKGKGTFVVGRIGAYDDWQTDGKHKEILVTEGYLEGDNDYSFEKTYVTFNGGGVAARLAGGDSAMATFGSRFVKAGMVTFAGAKLPVKIWGSDAEPKRGTKIPFLTVNEADAVGLAEKIEIACPFKNRRYDLVVDSVTCLGTACKRFSAKFMSDQGLSVIVR